jgi:hypothetical protein
LIGGATAERERARGGGRGDKELPAIHGSEHWVPQVEARSKGKMVQAADSAHPHIAPKLVGRDRRAVPEFEVFSSKFEAGAALKPES